MALMGSVAITSLSVAILASAAPASTVKLSDFPERRGAPITQRFLNDEGHNVSMVTTSQGVSCVASQPIAITESRYTAADGRDLPFAEITRSKASSLQAIAGPDQEASFRLQLKYSPDPEAPIVLTIGDQNFDLRAALEFSQDSLLLTGPTARALEAGLRSAAPLSLQATSAGTGRLVTDRIDAPDMAGLDTCLTMLENQHASVSDATALPVPQDRLQVALEASPDPRTRVTTDALAHCKMRDIPDTLYLGRLTEVSGFFAQTQNVYVSFDADGQVERAYIPGIFDANLTAGANTAYVSLAADSNLPDQPNTVSGCLGDALFAAPVCVISGSHDGKTLLGECGVLGALNERDEFLNAFLSPDPAPTWDVVPAGPSQRISAGNGRNFGGGGSGGRLLSSGGTALPGIGGGSEGGGSGDNDGDLSIPPVPLPAAGWLLLAGLGSLVLVRRR